MCRPQKPTGLQCYLLIWMLGFMQFWLWWVFPTFSGWHPQNGPPPIYFRSESNSAPNRWAWAMYGLAIAGTTLGVCGAINWIEWRCRRANRYTKEHDGGQDA